MPPKPQRRRPGMAKPYSISVASRNARTGAVTTKDTPLKGGNVALPEVAGSTSRHAPLPEFDTRSSSAHASAHSPRTLDPLPQQLGPSDSDDPPCDPSQGQQDNSFTYREKVNKAFTQWSRRVPSLVIPYLAGRRQQIISPPDLVAACAHSRLGINGFVNALFDFHRVDSGFASTDDTPKQLSRAATWFDLLSTEVRHHALQNHLPLAPPPSPGDVSHAEEPLPLPLPSSRPGPSTQSAQVHSQLHPAEAADIAPDVNVAAAGSSVRLPSLSRSATPSPGPSQSSARLVPRSDAAVTSSPASGAALGHLSSVIVPTASTTLSPHRTEDSASDSAPLAPTGTRLQALGPASPRPDDAPRQTAASATSSTLESPPAAQDDAEPLRFPRAEEDPDLRVGIDDLARRCPACFGGIASQEPRSLPALPTTSVVPSSQFVRSAPPTTLPSADVIICLDGNFTHKRRKRDDAIARSPTRPSFFLSHRQVDSAAQTFLASAKTDGPRTGCSSEVKAAVEGAVKASKGSFDIVGLVGMTCRHGAPLLFCDVRETGEAHFYAFALLDHLLQICAGRIDTLGICYDIGCKLAASPRIKASLAPRGVKLVFVVSLFHVFGHDVDCRTKYSPRRTTGFGTTDGESLERLWSAMSEMISVTRGMSRVGRHLALTAHLAFLVHEHVGRLSPLLRTRKARLDAERGRAALQVERAVALVSRWADTLSVATAPKAVAPGSTLGVAPKLFPLVFARFAPDFAFLCDCRRSQAFQRKTYRRRGDGSSQDLHLAAKSLWICLSQWHALTDFIKRRNAIASQKTQARLMSAKTAAQSKARRLCDQVNEAITAALDLTAILNMGPLHAIPADQLWTVDTLARVTRYAGGHVDENEPWFSDAVLEDGLDAYELLVRCDEEEQRIDRELANLDLWLQQVRNTLARNRAAFEFPGWGHLLDEEVGRLDALAKFWERPLPKRRGNGAALPQRSCPEPDGLIGGEDEEPSGIAGPVSIRSTAPGVVDEVGDVNDANAAQDEDEANASEFSVADDELVQQIGVMATHDSEEPDEGAEVHQTASTATHESSEPAADQARDQGIIGQGASDPVISDNDASDQDMSEGL
ncbi:hypothetical protein OC842_006689 [Tilletia horrida]|uniref:CxC1-like cysteine cluster associated with KDZ transposases domain-containing protein n=1 Tax=Tilletia horrida TaxID=155126 RepID=A0AAN6JHQ0_9BASI|nr:hypothetical protein OC842_006689 [Tilletia horrida]